MELVFYITYRLEKTCFESVIDIEKHLSLSWIVYVRETEHAIFTSVLDAVDAPVRSIRQTATVESPSCHTV
jgi:hypothetical protein